MLILIGKIKYLVTTQVPDLIKIKIIINLGILINMEMFKNKPWINIKIINLILPSVMIIIIMEKVLHNLLENNKIIQTLIILIQLVMSMLILMVLIHSDQIINISIITILMMVTILTVIQNNLLQLHQVKINTIVMVHKII